MQPRSGLWADSSWRHFCSFAYELTHRKSNRIYQLGSKIKELVNLCSLCKFQLFAISNKEKKSIKNWQITIMASYILCNLGGFSKTISPKLVGISGWNFQRVKLLCSFNIPKFQFIIFIRIMSLCYWGKKWKHGFVYRDEIISSKKSHNAIRHNNDSVSGGSDIGENFVECNGGVICSVNCLAEYIFFPRLISVNSFDTNRRCFFSAIKKMCSMKLAPISET